MSVWLLEANLDYAVSYTVLYLRDIDGAASIYFDVLGCAIPAMMRYISVVTDYLMYHHRRRHWSYGIGTEADMRSISPSSSGQFPATMTDL